MALGMEVGLGPATLCQMRTQHPPQKEVHPPEFSAHVYFGPTAGCVKMPLGMKVCLSPGNFVLVGDPAPSPKSGGAPQFFFARLL